MRILIDADACPVKEIAVRMAKNSQVPVIMVTDTCHQLEDGYSEVIVVDKARDSADIKLANLMQKGDIVITQDYGVAAMALGKGAAALNQSGLIYCEDNMDRLLFERHIKQKIRRAHGVQAVGKAGNIKKRTKQDDEAFASALEKLLAQR